MKGHNPCLFVDPLCRICTLGTNTGLPGLTPSHGCHMLLYYEAVLVHLDCVADGGLGDAAPGARGLYAATRRGLAYRQTSKEVTRDAEGLTILAS